MNDNMPHVLDDDDDLLAMEQSCLKAFIGEGQLAHLLTLWQNRESGDNNVFMNEFVYSLDSDNLQTLPEEE